MSDEESYEYEYDDDDMDEGGFEYTDDEGEQVNDSEVALGEFSSSKRGSFLHYLRLSFPKDVR